MNITGITNDPYSYLALRMRYTIGLQRLEEKLGKHIELTDDGIPSFPTAGLQTMTSRPEIDRGVTDYSRELYTLARPWEKIMSFDGRGILSNELGNFAGGRYVDKEITEESRKKGRIERLTEKLLSHLLQEIEQRELKYKTKKTEVSSNSQGPLEITPPSLSPRELEEALAKRRHRRQTLEEERARERVAPYVNRMAIAAIFGNADTAYLFAILSADGEGIKHPTPRVRLGTLNILEGFAIASLQKTLGNIEKKPIIIGAQNLEQEALTSLRTLEGIYRILNSRNYGIYDSNSLVRQKAESLEEDIIHGLKLLKDFIKPPEATVN